MTAGGLTGCASSQMNRIDRNRDVYETWPIETRQAVLDGRVEPGMTPHMVEVAWGKPTEVVNGSGGDEIWVYKTGGSDGAVYYPGGGMGTTGGMSGTGTGIGISTGRGGTTIGTSGGIGIGSGGIGIGSGGTNIGMGTGGMGGMGSPIVTPPTPPDIKEVVFRQGVVFRADQKR
ncbi:MAG: hypothetical protein ABIR80_21565 [Opitutaceae bacterium]